ncbi:hypothetical protein AOHp20_01690 [Helicobacter pylori]
MPLTLTLLRLLTVVVSLTSWLATLLPLELGVLPLPLELGSSLAGGVSGFGVPLEAVFGLVVVVKLDCLNYLLCRYRLLLELVIYYHLFFAA